MPSCGSSFITIELIFPKDDCIVFIISFKKESKVIDPSFSFGILFKTSNICPILTYILANLPILGLSSTIHFAPRDKIPDQLD